jgi:hypothetical protein
MKEPQDEYSVASSRAYLDHRKSPRNNRHADNRRSGRDSDVEVSDVKVATYVRTFVHAILFESEIPPLYSAANSMI